MEKKKKKNVITKLMRVLQMDEKKYKIQKYFRFEDNKNVMFTIENEKNGIPVIQANS